MLVIRFVRTGRRNLPMYRVVVAEKARAVKRKNIAILGSYNPHTKEASLKKEEIQKYLDNGAQPSNSVARLFKNEGIKLPKWVTIVERNKKSKQPEPEPVEAPAESIDEPTTEDTPDEEVSEKVAEEKTQDTEEAKTDE